MTASDWRGLHPASVFVNLIPATWRTIRSSWPLFVLIIVQGSVQGAVNLLLVVLFFGMAVARTILHYLTLRYRVFEGRLEIATGLVSRNHRTIDPNRIQNMEIVQNVFHKLANLVELRIETAGDSGVEGLLSAITVEEAEALRAQLARHAPAPSGEEAAEALKLGIVEVIGYGISAGRIGAAAVVIGLGVDAVAQMQPTELREATERLSAYTIGGVLLLSLAGAYLFSAGNAVLRYAGFRLWDTASGIVTESGLFTRRRVEIPRRKVQSVRIEEPLLRRMMGFASLHLDTASSGLPPSVGGVSGEALVPMVDSDNRLFVLSTAMPTLSLDPWTVKMAPPARRQLYRALFRAMVTWTAIAVGAWLGTGSLWVFGLVAWALLSAALDWRGQGWLVSDTHVLARRGFFRRSTWVVAREKIQSVHRHEGPLMRVNGLAQVEVWIAGDRVALPVVDRADADATFARLAHAVSAGAGSPPAPTR
jgi:putative membrane protein